MHLIRKRWTRRDFMRAAGIGAGGVALSSWVPTLSTEAQGTAPKRLLLLSHGNGSVLDRWRDNGSGEAFVDGAALPALRGPILEPLDAHRDKLLLLDGIDLTAIHVEDDGSFRKHGSKGHAGSSVLFTGRNGGGTGFDGDAGSFPDMPSIDQIINDRIGDGRKTLQLSVWNRPFDPRSVYNYGDGGSPLSLESNPQVAFDDVFRDGFGGSEGAPDRIAPRRQRTLSLLRGQIARLRGELPADDRIRLDQHVAGLDGLEARLSVPTSVMCTAGADDRPTITNVRNDTPASLSAQIENMVHAFACDRVRVGTLQLVPENSWSTVPFLSEWGALGGGGAHSVSHYQNQEPSTARREAAVDQMTALNRFCSQNVARILTRLEETGLMDDTLVVWAPAMSHGGYHSNQNVPFVIAQGRNGPLRTNRYLRWGDYIQPPTGSTMGYRQTYDAGNESNNNLMISICHAMGLDDVREVGEAQFCRPDGLDGALL